MIAPAAEAALWGLAAGFSLVLGAALGYLLHLPQRLIAIIMAFGAGVLIAALAFELMDEAAARGGVAAALGGFIAGAALYAAVNAALAFQGARHRKRSGPLHGAAKGGGAALAIALGSLIDGLPESAAIGISLLDGEGVGAAVVIAVCLSNVPEGLSSAAGMKRAGRSPLYIFGVWGSIGMLCAAASYAGYSAFAGLPPFYIAAALGLAAGAILVMIVDTMIPEAFEETHALAGPVAAAGFLLAFAVHHAA